MNKELQSFAYVSSHDLQEPLRKIQIFSEQILMNEDNKFSEDGKDKFSRVKKAAGRMQILIDDLLQYSRTTGSERKFETVNLAELAAEVTEDFKEEIRENDAIIDVGRMCEAYVIRFQFRQLLYNLVSNALKFRKPGSTAVILIDAESGKGKQFKNPRLRDHANYCRVSVSDNGIGFEPEFSEKIFEVFQRLHGRHEFSGTGIGLAIVKKVVENHGGLVVASSEPGKGAMFEVYLPQEG